MQQCSLRPDSAPTPHFITLCLNIPVTNQEKPIITQEAPVTQSSKIVYCDWHTQKPICTDFQAFSKTFVPVQIDVFYIFCQGEICKQLKGPILLILTGKNAEVNRT